MKRPRTTLGLLAGAVLGSGIGYAMSFVVDVPEQEFVDPTTVPTHAERLIKQHDCWTGEAPKDMQDKIPGGVIIRYTGNQMAVHGGEPAVGKALDHLFNNPDPSIDEVIGFCR